MTLDSQPGTPIPLTSTPPPPPAPRKSRKWLWIGLGIGALLLVCCVAVIALVLIFRSQIPALTRLFDSSSPLSLGLQNLQSSDANFDIKLLSVGTSSDTLYDSSGNSASPVDGYVYLVVKTQLVTKGTDHQEFMLIPGAGDAVLTDSAGNSYYLSGVDHGSSISINMPGSITTLYFYNDEPDGTPMDFYFSVPTGTTPASFQFKDLSPFAPLPAP
jgi:hypothetical protein